MSRLLLLLCGGALAAFGFQIASPPAPSGPLDPTPVARLFDVLDLTRPGLEAVRAAAGRGDRAAALQALAVYYRDRAPAAVFPPSPAAAPDPAVLAAADRAARHIFDVGLGYGPQDYGPSIDWDSDPVKDIEWRANIHRFYWQRPLVAAYRATHEEKYARAWFALTLDWIRKHPVDPPAFPWLDIQVGIRAGALAEAFDLFRHSPSLTPEFLEAFLPSIGDHARKSSIYPRRDTHNKVILEVMGLTRVAVMFPEFRQSGRWLARSFDIFQKALADQINREGVQVEWTPNYHAAVVGETAEILALCQRNRVPVPPLLRQITEQAFRYWVAMTAPDFRLPMFGDTTRDPAHAPSPEAFHLAAELFGRPEFAAMAGHRREGLAAIGSSAFPAAGTYIFRTGWQPDSLYMALHNSPPAPSSHLQPDGGTFELYYGGRWVMPDTGVYAYPNTPLAAERDWFRRTASHQTLTAGGKDSANAPVFWLWQESEQGGVLCFENSSYPTLGHRRTVFFAGRRYFVLVDEAIGEAEGPLDLHFQFAPGELALDAGGHSAHTTFSAGGNVLVWQSPTAPVTLSEEPGQTSAVFNRKERRPAMAYRYRGGAPAVFVTVVAPYLAGAVPQVEARTVGSFAAGGARLEVELTANGERWRMGRDLATGQGWVQPAPR